MMYRSFKKLGFQLVALFAVSGLLYFTKCFPLLVVLGAALLSPGLEKKASMRLRVFSSVSGGLMLAAGVLTLCLILWMGWSLLHEHGVILYDLWWPFFMQECPVW
jgi:hypothetical protein